uniref:sulfatase family protein n=1 Tax=Daejeonella sp. TaxID=2805397 RepID=UPI00404960C6
MRFYLILCCLVLTAHSVYSQNERPNIIYILADDLGIGDVSIYNKDSKIQTKNIDALAAEGMRFTDAHSGSAVCTPTRYGILTGRYAWRTHLQNGVLWGYDTALIARDRYTLANLFKNKGYSTACIGKWHLGLGWQKDKNDQVDFSKPLSTGPNSAGFDYSYIISASLDIPPYVYIENQQVTSTTIENIKENKGAGFWREGPIGKGQKHSDVLVDFTNKAIAYIQNQASKKAGPFFLYLPLTSPHTPILPTKEFEGKSGINAYADFVLMTDAVLGKIKAVLQQTGLDKNTILVFTSDNGASPMADFKTLESKGHFSSAGYRGAKADIFEGGHRIPFIIKWPGKITPNTMSSQTISLTDFMATAAKIIGSQLIDNQAEDSYSLLPILLNKPNDYKRESIIHHSIDGKFAIRKGDYKLILARGSGGWSAPTESDAVKLKLQPIQLYNLKSDKKEQFNLAASMPLVVKELTELLQKQIQSGRSTEGRDQKNDVMVRY